MEATKKYRIKVTTDANSETLFMPEYYDVISQSYQGFPGRAPLSFLVFSEEGEARTFLIKTMREEKERKIRDLYLANKKTILQIRYIEDMEGNEEI